MSSVKMGQEESTIVACKLQFNVQLVSMVLPNAELVIRLQSSHTHSGKYCVWANSGRVNNYYVLLKRRDD